MTEVVQDLATELFGSREVRWYQAATRTAVVSAIRAGRRRPLIVLPTGAGKTLTIAITVASSELRDILKIPADRNIRVVVVAHLTRLLTQAESTFASSEHVDLRTQSAFQAISPETAEWADLYIIDEAHHEAMMTIQMQLDTMGDKPIIGLTATNVRPDGLLLKFDDEIALLSREKAVEEGWLAESSVWTIVNSQTMCGRQADADTVDITTRTIQQYHSIMAKTMVFMRTRSEVARLVENLTNLGLTAIGLVNQSAKQIEEALNAYDQGQYQFIVNCAKLGEGVDCPDTTSVVIARTVGSLTQLNQIIGRSSRPSTESYVFELVNPLHPDTLSAVDVIGIPKQHQLVYEDVDGSLLELPFDVDNYLNSTSTFDM